MVTKAGPKSLTISPYPRVCRRTLPDLPIFLLGLVWIIHQPGYAQERNAPYTGVILSGSDFYPPLQFKLAQPIARAGACIVWCGGRSP